jgi:RNA polymerase sigma factor (sigma-70 family)
MTQSDPGIGMDLIRRARDGDRDSGETLARWAQEWVYPYVYRMTLDYHLAQDLCQDTLVEMARFLPRLTLERPGDLRAWLYKTALSKVQDHYRRKKPRSTEALSSSDRAGLEARMARPDPGSAALEKQDLARIMWQAMEQLKPKYRHILSLRCVDELSYAEIATIQGGTELQARLLFFRAKAHLRQQLSRRGYGRGQMLGALALFGTLTASPKAEAASIAVTEETLKVGPAAAAAGALTSKTGLAAAALVACLAVTSPWIIGLHALTPPRIDPAVALTPAEANEVDRIVARLLPETDYITVALIRDGRLVFARSYGQRADILRMGPYASVCKPITALLIMQLVEQGKITDLNEPFWNYCPAYQGSMPDAFRDNPVTLRTLLCHTSGLPMPKAADEPWRQDGKLILASTPGTKAAYSSLGYALLGQVLEHVTGRPYEELVRERVARPLGLRSMTATPGFWAPVGSIRSTIEDFARLAIGIMDGAVVKTDTLYQQMWVRNSDASGGYGLGWDVRNQGTDDLTVGHGGLTPRVCSKILLKPRHKNGVVLFAGARATDPYLDMNRLNQDAGHLAQDLLARLN